MVLLPKFIFSERPRRQRIRQRHEGPQGTCVMKSGLTYRAFPVYSVCRYLRAVGAEAPELRGMHGCAFGLGAQRHHNPSAGCNSGAGELCESALAAEAPAHCVVWAQRHHNIDAEARAASMGHLCTAAPRKSLHASTHPAFTSSAVFHCNNLGAPSSDATAEPRTQIAKIRSRCTNAQWSQASRGTALTSAALSSLQVGPLYQLPMEPGSPHQ